MQAPDAPSQPVHTPGPPATCGAQTRICACGHHAVRHPRQQDGGPRLACDATHDGAPCPCRAFAPRACRRRDLIAGGRCRMHGGLSLSGPAVRPAPRALGHGYYEVLPERLREHVERMAQMENKLSLAWEVELLRGQLAEVLDQVKDGAGYSRLVTAAAAAIAERWRKFLVAQRAGRPGPIGEALSELGAAIEALDAAVTPAAQQREMRAQSVELAKAIERLTRSENTRLAEVHGMITAEAALALQSATAAALIGVLDEHVADVEARAAIRRAAARRLAELVGRRDPPAPGPWDAAADPAAPAALVP